MPLGFDLQHAKSIFFVKEGNAFDQPGEAFHIYRIHHRSCTGSRQSYGILLFAQERWASASGLLKPPLPCRMTALRTLATNALSVTIPNPYIREQNRFLACFDRGA